MTRKCNPNHIYYRPHEWFPKWFVHPPYILKSCDIKVEKTGAACGTNVGHKKCIRSLKGKPTGIRLFGRPSCRWDNINRLGGS
jgi:hypothetical protein